MQLKLVKTITDPRVAAPNQINEEAHDLYLDDKMDKGSVVLVKFRDRDKLFIACPGCGVASFTGNHRIEDNNGVFTAHPSLVMNCCGWHGWLRNNQFTSV